MRNVNEEYRSLLTAHESITTMDAVIDLLLRVANGAASAQTKRTSKSKDRRWVSIPDIASDLATSESRTRAGKTGHARTAAGLSARAARVAWLLENMSARLDQRKDIPDTQYSLLMDSLLLLFHQAYFVLLPKMRGEGWRGEQSALLAAFGQFAAHLPRDADRYQVLGLVFEARENVSEAADCYRKALNATHADDHDFITRVQMLWTHLHEMGDLNGAGRLLLDIYPRVPRKDLEEVSEMIWDTMQAFERRGAAMQPASV